MLQRKLSFCIAGNLFFRFGIDDRFRSMSCFLSGDFDGFGAGHVCLFFFFHLHVRHRPKLTDCEFSVTWMTDSSPPFLFSFMCDTG